jgi:hypothetical protein
MYSVQTKLTEQHAAAELAYRFAVAQMNEMRDLEFERAWRLAENRRRVSCAGSVGARAGAFVRGRHDVRERLTTITAIVSMTLRSTA